MKVVHKLTITSTCPVDGLPDVYQVTVRASRVIKVETILEMAASFANKKIYQEEMTFELARGLAAVVTTGWLS
jgi:NADPH-dependent 7-cyano-7-deazaguanine reductase QueF